MEITAILLAGASISGLGLLFGLVLGYAGKKFETAEDPRINEVMQSLPGANCGGCGYAGCEAFAAAVLSGEAKVEGCAVNSPEGMQKIFDNLGIKAIRKDKQVAYVKCNGNFANSLHKYDYNGMDDCGAMMMLPGGGLKACCYGCLGGGSCAKVCIFDAIEIKDGAAVIDNEKCTACGICVDKCPKGLIAFKPYNCVISIRCNSGDLGKVVKSLCGVGCIGCKICEKVCKFEAIRIESGVAMIDYDNCKGCGVCVKKCPMGVIVAQ